MKKSIYTKKHEQFCQLLIQKRKAAGLTQQELAQKLDRPQSFVAKCEGGQRRVDLVEFVEIMQILGVDPVVFLKDILKSG